MFLYVYIITTTKILERNEVSNMAVIKSKRTGYGLIEIRDSSILGWFALYIDGSLKEQSADYNYIESQYNKY